MSIKETYADRVIDWFIIFLLCIVACITLYPMIYVFSMSISDPEAVMRKEIFLFPIGFSIKSYIKIFENSSIWRSYVNSIWYTVVGTLFNIIMALIGGYPLSRKYFFARSQIMVFMAITMFFSGGLIPLFILINNLGLYNTRWAIVVPAAVSTWYLIIARVYFQSSVPDSLPESAKIEGCSDIGILFRIVIPTSGPIIAAIALFSAVGFWNSWFAAILYLPDGKLHPVTIILQRILISNDTALMVGASADGQTARMMIGMQLKYSIIITTILPISIIYPFLQKYFVKGVMIGAIKE